MSRPKAFVSYRRKTSAMLATLIAHELEGRGIDVFVDTRRTDGGGPFPDRLLRAIESADVFVCLLADGTFDSDWVRREIEHAHTLGKVLIPVFQETYVAPPAPDAHIHALLQSDGVHVMDVKNIYVDEAINQLTEMIRRSVPARRSSRRPLWIGLAATLMIVILGIVALVASGLLGGGGTPNAAGAVGTLTAAARQAAVPSEQTTTAQAAGFLHSTAEAETQTAIAAENVRATETASAVMEVTPASATIPPTPVVALPPEYDVITVNNAARLTEVARLGGGVFYSSAISPDGQRLAVAGSTGVWLYTFPGMEPEGLLEGHKSPVVRLAFSPDGTRLASGSAEGELRIWDVAQRREIAALEGHTAALNDIVFSPDGRLLATAVGADTGCLGWQREVRLWDLTTFTYLSTFGDDVRHAYSVAFSPDGAMLAAGLTGRVKVWSTADHADLAEYDLGEQEVLDVAFSPDGRLLAAAGQYTIPVWDASSFAEIARFEGHTDVIHSIAFSPDGQLLLAGLADSTIRVWDVERHTQSRPLIGHTGTVEMMAFLPDGRLVTSGADATVRQWDVAASTLLSTTGLGDGSALITSLALAADGRTLAAGVCVEGYDSLWDSCQHAGVSLWDMATRTRKAFLDQSSEVILAMAFGPDNTTLATGSLGQVTLWNTLTGELSDTLSAYSASVPSLRFSPDGNLLAAGCSGYAICLWTAESGAYEFLDTLSEHDGSVSDLAFTPDGRRLLSGSGDDTVILWDLETGAPIFRAGEGNRMMNYFASVAVSPDGRTAAAGDGQDVIHLWDIPSGVYLARLDQGGEWMEDGANGLAFSPDGALLAGLSSSTSNCVGVDRRICLWDTGTYSLLTCLEGHTAPITGIAFAPDGSYIATGSWDGTVRLWAVP